MAESLWWTYGVVGVPASIAPELHGIEEQRVELIQEDALAALASRVPADEFSGPALERRLNDLDTIGRMARAHEAVLEAALAGGDVIPFRICTLYVSEDALREMLVAERERLLGALTRVRGAIEVGVKAFSSGRRDDEEQRPASGKEYLALRLAQRGRAAEREESLERSTAELHARLTDRAAAAVLLRPQDRRLSGRDEEMLLNGAYLVRRSEASEFARLVEALGRGSDLALEITGPWPPYHFAETPA